MQQAGAAAVNRIAGKKKAVVFSSDHMFTSWIANELTKATHAVVERQEVAYFQGQGYEVERTHDLKELEPKAKKRNEEIRKMTGVPEDESK